ncbi:MAG TPA: CPBP family intramembrane glutamic endopeptidase [Propionibacteriaceae bacterium]|nr:CPBP family intramembrane glutamic endopeptidase [Propionibacteriaceae bacterium]
MITAVLRELGAFFTASLVTPVPRDHRETRAQLRRRRIVSAVTLVAGAAALGAALSIRPGDPAFYAATLGVAAIWTVGAFASGRLYLGRAHTREGRIGRPVLQAFVLGAALLLIFLAGALVVAHVPLLRHPVDHLLDHARHGSWWLVGVITAVNGVAEELFFRGSLYAAIDERWNGPVTVVLYAASTLVSGVPLLTLAALCLGLLTTAERRVTGGVLGPIVTHVTWSLGMLYLLPLMLSLGG